MGRTIFAGPSAIARRLCSVPRPTSPERTNEMSAPHLTVVIVRYKLESHLPRPALSRSKDTLDSISNFDLVVRLAPFPPEEKWSRSPVVEPARDPCDPSREYFEKGVCGMGMLKEFKEFAVKGNAIDMAVGIVIGGAFTPIVKSLVADIIMPPIGLVTGGIDFSEKVITLKEAVLGDDGAEVLSKAVTINYGNFINVMITFLIVAFAVFLLVKGMNKMRKEEPAPAPNTKKCGECLMTIPIEAKKCGHCTSAI